MQIHELIKKIPLYLFAKIEFFLRKNCVGSVIFFKRLIGNPFFEMSYKKRHVYLDIDNFMEYKFRIFASKKEPETVEWIEGRFKEGDVFFDVGANVGVYSLIADAYFSKKIKVFAFEPAFFNYNKLCRNVWRNKAKIRCYPFAISDKTEDAELYLHDMKSGSAQHNLDENVDDMGERYESPFIQNVLAVSLDELVSRFGFPVPDHLKIDVDGLEQKIIRGAKNTLCNGKLKTVMLETNERLFDSGISDAIKAAGLTLTRRVPRGRKGVFNCFFERR